MYSHSVHRRDEADRHRHPRRDGLVVDQRDREREHRQAESLDGPEHQQAGEVPSKAVQDHGDAVGEHHEGQHSLLAVEVPQLAEEGDRDRADQQVDRRHPRYVGRIAAELGLDGRERRDQHRFAERDQERRAGEQGEGGAGHQGPGRGRVRGGGSDRRSLSRVLPEGPS